MIADRMAVLRATLAARASFLRAQAAVADSVSVKAELSHRADEVDFLLGQVN